MANVQKAIIKAIVEGVITELMVKSQVDNIYLTDGTTTLASKLAEMVTAINERAKTSDMNTTISNAISALRTELMGEGVPEAYDTFKEIANYIAEHQEVADSLTSAIGNKADKSTVTALQNTINALGALAQKDKISESDLDSALAEKVNAASDGNHSHSNKNVLDGITAAKVSSWDDAAESAHTHGNKTVLDGITAAKVSNWNKNKISIGTSQPADLAENELFIQLV